MVLQTFYTYSLNAETSTLLAFRIKLVLLMLGAIRNAISLTGKHRKRKIIIISKSIPL